jgi:hypothetical protein
MEVKDHGNWGHGLQPGTTHDMNCTSCRRETHPLTSALDSQGSMRPGTQGWWKVWGARLSDVKAGDMIMVGTKAEDGSHVISEHTVTSIIREDGLAGVMYFTFTDQAGERHSYGVLCPVQVVRQGTHNTLAGSV